MSTDTDISALYHEFTDALTEILAENAVAEGGTRMVSERRSDGSRFPADRCSLIADY